MAKKPDVVGELQNQIAEKMMEIIKDVIENRSDFYKDNPDKIPDRNDVEKIITQYSSKSMLVSGTAGLIPGPLGMIAVIPEILTIISYQIKVIYDIGVAYGKQKLLTKELILNVFASAAVTGGIGIVTIQSSKVLVQRASKNLIQKILQLVAAKTSQGAFRSMVGKYIPFVGAAAIAAWSNYSTRKVGKKAVEIFERDIEYVSEVPEDCLETSPEEESVETARIVDDLTEKYSDVAIPADINLNELRVQALINLMLVDGQAHPEEQEYIREILDNVELDYFRKKSLLESLDKAEKFKVNYEAISRSPDDALGLLIDLVTLSNHDGKFHISEKMYVKKVGKCLGFLDSEVEEMMNVDS